MLYKYCFIFRMKRRATATQLSNTKFAQKISIQSTYSRSLCPNMIRNAHLTVLLPHYTSVQSYHNSGTYHTVRRVFLFNIDIKSCSLLPSVLPQLFPLRDVFKFLAAKTSLERGELKIIAWQRIRLICIK